MANVAMLSTIADQTASQIAGAASALMPSGVILPFGGTTAPTGWLICDGSAISRTTYAALFSAVGTTHGTGDGSTTFNLPDMRGVFPRGSGTNGTSNYGGVTGHTPAGGSVGNKGGQKTAKNGLSNASSAVTTAFNNSDISHTHSANHDHAANESDIRGQHSHTFYSSTATTDDGDAPNRNRFGLNPSSGNHTTSLGGNHSHTVDLPNLNVTTGSGGLTTFQPSVNSNTAAAQTMSSADTETTPASLSLNYIIKL